MKLLQEIIDTLPDKPIQVRKVIIGIHWTLVASKYCGLASTMVGQEHHGHVKIKDVGELTKKSAQELATWSLSDNLLEACIGIAAINSILDLNEQLLNEVNASEVIAKHCVDKNLAIIGHFPFVEKMKTIAHNCWIIEKRPQADDFPEEAAKDFIPQSDVVAISGTTFINHSIENLLSLCPPSALVMVLGPSTPMTPLLFDYGISFLSGSRVIDEEAAITTIQEGAIFPQVKGIRILTMSKEI